MQAIARNVAIVSCELIQEAFRRPSGPFGPKQLVESEQLWREIYVPLLPITTKAAWAPKPMKAIC